MVLFLHYSYSTPGLLRGIHVCLPYYRRTHTIKPAPRTTPPAATPRLLLGRGSRRPSAIGTPRLAAGRCVKRFALAAIEFVAFCEPWSRRLRSSRRRSPSPRPSARASNPVSPVGRPVRFHLILITNQPRPPESSVERVKAGLKPTRAWSPRAVYYGLGTRVARFETRPRTGRPAGSCLRRPLPTPGRSSSLAPLRPLPIWSPALRQPGPTPSSRPLLPSQEMASAAAPAAPSSAEDAEEGLRWRKDEWAGGHAFASAATGGGGGAGTTGSCKVRAS